MIRPLLGIILLALFLMAAENMVKAAGFSGRFPVVGYIGAGPGSGGCTGTIDASAGCPLPMLGM